MVLRGWLRINISDSDWKKVNLVCKNRQEYAPPIRGVDQIYMKPEYMIIQTKLMASELQNKRVIFMGDGDQMSLMFGLYAIEGSLPSPDHMLVLDFDKRVLTAIKRFASKHGFGYLITTELYNVKWKVPEEYKSWGDFFYTNPAYGSKTEPKGLPVIIFVDRCLSMCAPKSSGCIIFPYDLTRPWTLEVVKNVQTYLIKMNCVIREMIKDMHMYNLDDDPNLRSSTIIIDRLGSTKTRYKSDEEIPLDHLRYFYGSSDAPVPEYIEKSGTYIYKKECLRDIDYDTIKKMGRTKLI